MEPLALCVALSANDLSVYPASSSEAVAAEDKPSWTDISSVQTAPEPAGIDVRHIPRYEYINSVQTSCLGRYR